MKFDTKKEAMDNIKIQLLELNDNLIDNSKLIANSAIQQNITSVLNKWFGGVNDKQTSTVSASGKAYRTIDYPKNPSKKKPERKNVVDNEQEKLDVQEKINMDSYKESPEEAKTIVNDNPMGLKGA